MTIWTKIKVWLGLVPGVTVRDYTVDDYAKWKQSLRDELMKLGDQPMTEATIARRGPPACPYCGANVGKCVHTGGPMAAVFEPSGSTEQ